MYWHQYRHYKHTNSTYTQCDGYYLLTTLPNKNKLKYFYHILYTTPQRHCSGEDENHIPSITQHKQGGTFLTYILHNSAETLLRWGWKETWLQIKKVSKKIKTWCPIHKNIVTQRSLNRINTFNICLKP